MGMARLATLTWLRSSSRGRRMTLRRRFLGGSIRAGGGRATEFWGWARLGCALQDPPTPVAALSSTAALDPALSHGIAPPGPAPSPRPVPRHHPALAALAAGPQELPLTRQTSFGRKLPRWSGKPTRTRQGVGEVVGACWVLGWGL